METMGVDGTVPTYHINSFMEKFGQGLAFSKLAHDMFKNWLVNLPAPNVPPQNSGVIRPYQGKPLVDKPLIRPYIWGGTLGGGRLTSHDLARKVANEGLKLLQVMIAIHEATNWKHSSMALA